MAYATVAETTTYVRSYYSSTDAIRIAWEELSEGDKQVMLNKAAQIIDFLPLKGKPVHANKAFPRYPHKDEIPEVVKIANMELALQSQNSEAKERYELRHQGVQSYKIGDLSENFGSSGIDTGVDEFAFSIVYPFLRDWLGGGYRICPTRIRR